MRRGGIILMLLIALAAFAVGATYRLYSLVNATPEEIKKNRTLDRTFEPAMSEEIREELLAGWHKAVKCSFGWAAEEKA